MWQEIVLEYMWMLEYKVGNLESVLCYIYELGELSMSVSPEFYQT